MALHRLRARDGGPRVHDVVAPRPARAARPHRAEPGPRHWHPFAGHLPEGHHSGLPRATRGEGRGVASATDMRRDRPMAWLAFFVILTFAGALGVTVNVNRL